MPSACLVRLSRAPWTFKPDLANQRRRDEKTTGGGGRHTAALIHYAFYSAYYAIPQFPKNLPIMLKNMPIIPRKVPIILVVKQSRSR